MRVHCGVHRRRSHRVLTILAVGAALLTGCASSHEPEVERVATTFEDPSADPQERCDLLIPATRAALEQSGSALREEAIEDLPLEGGAVDSVEIWGGDAQVKLTGDTVFLSETSDGWRITSAACTPRAEAPYDCEVDGP